MVMSSCSHLNANSSWCSQRSMSVTAPVQPTPRHRENVSTFRCSWASNTGPADRCFQHRNHSRASVRTHGTYSWSTNNYMNGFPPTKPPTVANGVDSSNGAANGAEPAAAPANGALSKADFPKFVQFFRNASPYIAGHRGKTFVIVIPGNVTSNRPLLQSIMSDIALLHVLGVNLVVVAGAQNLIDDMLQERGIQPQYVGGYRVTDKDALKAAMEAAGQVRTTCEQMLSKGPAIPMIRRHAKGEGEIHFEPALRVISGNFIAAKRRGVVDGTDFGYTGEVRFVLKDDIERQLEGGNLVLLSNLGFTAAGEVLNCNTYDVGLHAAVELGADKLFFLHLDEVKNLQLPPWLPLSDAQQLLVDRLQTVLGQDQLQHFKETTMETHNNTGLGQQQQHLGSTMATRNLATPSPMPSGSMSSMEAAVPSRSSAAAPATDPSAVVKRLATKKKEDLVVDLDVWSAIGLPTAVSTCVVACCKGERGRESLKMMASMWTRKWTSFERDVLKLGRSQHDNTDMILPDNACTTHGNAVSHRIDNAQHGNFADHAHSVHSAWAAHVDTVDSRMHSTGTALLTRHHHADAGDADQHAHHHHAIMSRLNRSGWETAHSQSLSETKATEFKGIKRAHLLDARLDGGLLLELYSRDGVGTMISADFYEGIRKALPVDLDSIQALLRPLEEAGTLVKRSREEIANMLPDFTVLERENKVLGCALLLPLGEDEQGVCVAELGAFCVDPAFRGSGRGDSLLDYVEQEARLRGIERMVLLTTRTADWFEQRDFKWVGAAYASALLPEARRARVNPARNSQLYVKAMEAPDGTLVEPGKRIGF